MTSTDRFQVVPAAYLALLRGPEEAPEVLLQLRSGTGFMDGWWACAAAGHVEAGETAYRAAAREADEELGVQVDPDDLDPVVVVQRTCALPDPLEQRVDLFFGTRTWTGEPSVQEPEKTAELRWWPLSRLPDRTVPHERRALEHLATGAPPTLLTHGFAQTVTLVAAVGRNGVIGDGTAMPWHLPEDLRHFKETTAGGVLVMGRATWESIGRPLPGRRTVVLTRDRGWSAPGAEVAHSWPEALLTAGDQEVFVVGGGQVYADAIAWADRLVVSEVDQAPPGGTVFPPVDPARWREVSRDPREGFTIVVRERR
ncbi:MULTISPECIES: dihydrofolate reductase [Ornithinimicrobium]|uniref:dihydrofolate reductase n=1 Tax=Ornithinimicrobium kibberense TaxID=282060 RepID=A0ABV5UZZ5_9MICO|nr:MULTISPECIES: dihydrofolate reductase [Ornithinimicrobium]